MVFVFGLISLLELLFHVLNMNHHHHLYCFFLFFILFYIYINIYIYIYFFFLKKSGGLEDHIPFSFLLAFNIYFLFQTFIYDWNLISCTQRFIVI